MIREKHILLLAFFGLVSSIFAVGLAPPACGADVLPKPDYDNTFHFFFVNGFHWRGPAQTAYRPEWSWHTGRLEPWMAEEILKDMLRYAGPPGPYATIGTVASVYPLLWVDPAQGWDYSISGGAGGLPIVMEWRESPGAPASPRIVDGGRDNGLHLLDLVLQPSLNLSMPVAVFLHGYNHSPQRWEDNGYDPAIPLDLTAYLETMYTSCMVYQDGKVTISDDLDGIFEPWDYVEDPAWNGNGIKGTFLTMSRLLDPRIREDYVHRNYQQALQHLADLQGQFPGVISALTIDPEIEQNNIRLCQGEAVPTDFSNVALEEWRLWLRHEGIYDDQTGAYAGEGCPDNGGQGYPSLLAFNQLTGSSFSSWDEVDPRSPLAGPGLLDMYLDGGDLDGFFSGLGDTSIQGWGEVMVDHFCEDLAAWAVNILEPYGWNDDMVFTHQIPGGYVDEAIDPGAPWGYYFRMTPLIAAQVEKGSVGITGFRENTANERLFGVLRDSLSGDRNWGHFEWNPISWVLDPTGASSNDYEFWTDAFDTTYSYGCHLLAAYRWWVPPELEPWSSIWPYAQAFRVRGEPVDFPARLQACHDFIQSIRFQPFSKYNNGPGVTPDYDPPAVGGVTGRYEGTGDVTIQWAMLIWPDVPRFYWYDPQTRPLWPDSTNVFGWPDFTMGRFEVYRDTVALFQPGPDNLLASVSNRDSTYADSTASVDGWYYYRVFARDNDSTLSTGARTVAMIPEMALDPTAIADTVPQGTVLQDSILVTNGGSFPLVFETWLEEDGGAAPSWAAVSPQADTLLPGASGTLALSLGLGGPEAGAYAATLLFTTNDPYQRLVQVPVQLLVEGAPADDPYPGSDRLSASVRPNPVSRQAVFTLRGAARETVLLIYDLSGRLVDSVPVGGTEASAREFCWLRPANVAGGLYVWKVVTGPDAVRGRLVVAP